MQVFAATEIANMALDHIGQLTVDNIDAPSTDAESLLARHYHKNRLSVLRMHPWNFALEQAVITRIAETPAFDYTDAYDLPENFVRFESIQGLIEEDAATLYRIKGKSVLYNNGGASYINIRFIANVEDMSKWDALAIDCLTVRLAWSVCYQFTKSMKLKGMLWEQYLELTKMAAQVDTVEQPPRRREDSRIQMRRKKYAGYGAGAASIFEDTELI